MNTLENFIKGSSLVAAFPTLLYVGVFQMKNRQALLQKASSLELQNFLSIPFESIVVESVDNVWNEITPFSLEESVPYVTLENS